MNIKLENSDIFCTAYMYMYLYNVCDKQLQSTCGNSKRNWVSQNLWIEQQLVSVYTPQGDHDAVL